MTLEELESKQAEENKSQQNEVERVNTINEDILQKKSIRNLTLDNLLLEYRLSSFKDKQASGSSLIYATKTTPEFDWNIITSVNNTTQTVRSISIIVTNVPDPAVNIENASEDILKLMSLPQNGNNQQVKAWLKDNYNIDRSKADIDGTYYEIYAPSKFSRQIKIKNSQDPD